MIECAFQGRVGKNATLDRVKGGEIALLVFDVCVSGKNEDPDAPRWIRCSVFGDRAEQLVIEKGMAVYVEGKLTWAIWQPSDGRPPQASMRCNTTLVQPIGLIGHRRRPLPRPKTELPPIKPGYVAAWSQNPADTPFFDDTDAAVADLRGRP